jgi:flagellin-like hook-associated protein FlgL
MNDTNDIGRKYTASTRMAKYNVLVQASASMLAQANSSSDIALMLIR